MSHLVCRVSQGPKRREWEELWAVRSAGPGCSSLGLHLQRVLVDLIHTSILILRGTASPASRQWGPAATALLRFSMALALQ